MPANREADEKHGVTFWLCKPYDLPEDLDYFLIRANEEMLSQIGANVFHQGARFPGLENNVRQFPYNDDVRAKLQFLGLELMGAYVLSFTSTIDNSPDASYHLTWQPDAVDKGHWNIELLVPSDVDDPAITSVEASTLDCGESATVSLVDGVLHLGIPQGCNGTDGDNGLDGTDGTDGSDGREIELRVSGGYIQWRYVGDVAWTNLIATVTLKGDTGDKGDKGDKGDTGEIGDMGLQGIQGETGPQGEPGADGAPCDNCPPTTDTTTATEGEDTRCNVAAGVAAWAASKFDDTVSAFSAKIDEFTIISDSISAMVGLIPLTGDIISYYIQTLEDIFAAGISATEAAFTTEFKEDVLCLLYCHVGTDGALTDSEISSWQAAVEALAGYGVFAATYAKFLRSMLNDNFRRIALIYQHVDGACGCACLDDCPSGSTWSSAWDFKTTNADWYNSGFYGSYSAGVGWVSTLETPGSDYYRGLGIEITLPAGTTLTAVHVRGHGSLGSEVGVSDARGTLFYHDTPAIGNRIQKDEDNVNTPFAFDWTGSATSSSGVFGLGTTAGYDGTAHDPGGDITYETIVICGTGTKPAGLP